MAAALDFNLHATRTLVRIRLTGDKPDCGHREFRATTARNRIEHIRILRSVAKCEAESARQARRRADFDRRHAGWLADCELTGREPSDQESSAFRDEFKTIAHDRIELNKQFDKIVTEKNCIVSKYAATRRMPSCAHDYVRDADIASAPH